MISSPRPTHDRPDPTAPAPQRDGRVALRRRVFSAGLPVGIVTTVLVWIFERADGLIHAIDLYGIPVVTAGPAVAWGALRSGVRSGFRSGFRANRGNRSETRDQSWPVVISTSSNTTSTGSA